MRIESAWLAIAAAFCMLGSVARVAHADRVPRALVVVVAKGSTVSRMSHAELKRCFSGDPVVIDGERLVPFNLPPGSAERLTFDRLVLGMSAERVGRFWVDRKIRGESQAPRALPSALYVMKIVAKFPGAIGYVAADQVTADVRVVSIDGTASLK